MITRRTDFHIERSRAANGYRSIHRAIDKGRLSPDQVAEIVAKPYENERDFDKILEKLIQKSMLTRDHVTWILRRAEPWIITSTDGDQDLFVDDDQTYDPFEKKPVRQVGKFYGAVELLIQSRKLDPNHVSHLLNLLPTMYSQGARDETSTPRVNELLEKLVENGLITSEHTKQIIRGIHIINNPEAFCRGMRPSDPVFEFLKAHRLLRPEHTLELLNKIVVSEQIGRDVIEQLAQLNLLDIDAVDKIVERVDPNNNSDNFGCEVVVLLAERGLLTATNKTELLLKLDGKNEPAWSAIEGSINRGANRPRLGVGQLALPRGVDD